MIKPQDKLMVSLVEKQILEHSWVLETFLYVLVPTLSVFNIYCTLSRRFLASAILTMQLFCFLVILISIRNGLLDLVRIRIFRYVFRFQVMIFALYLIYVIGILQQFEVRPWSFLFVFFLFLWMPNRLGGLIAILFYLALFLLMFWPDPGVFMGNSDYLVRFFFSLALFSILSFCGVIVRKGYLKNLFQAKAELEVSEREYRNLSQRLMAEIAHRDRIEKRLHHAIKMETVGKVAAGVAHDLNNILSGIVTYPDLILLGMKKQDPLRGPIEMIKDSGIKAASIVDDLLTLSRRGVPVSTIMDIKQISEEYLHSPEFRQLKASHARVTLDTLYDSGPMTIKGSPVHLSKVLMNLVSNAAEAMPRGGEILIRVQARTFDQPEILKIPIQGQTEIPAGDYVVLSVIDTGVGIEAREIELVFEPFYTKKIMGMSGSGLGMSVVLGTVNDHKGFIQVDSAVEKGTCIKIYFPDEFEHGAVPTGGSF